jgi:hypothetical protein
VLLSVQVQRSVLWSVQVQRSVLALLSVQVPLALLSVRRLVQRSPLAL